MAVRELKETDNASNMFRLMSANKFIGNKNSKLYAVEIPALHLSYAALSKPSPGRSIALMALNRTSFAAVRPDQNPNTYTAAVSGLLDVKEVFATLSEKAQKIGVAGNLNQGLKAKHSTALRPREGWLPTSNYSRS